MRDSFLKKFVSPFWRLVLLLVLLPTLELFFSIYFFKMWVIPLMFVSGLIGVFIAYREGRHCWKDLNRQLDRGETPVLPALHGILILLAVLFMILPGLLTSLFGLFLLFPITRALVVSYLVLRFEVYRRQTRQENSSHSPDIIDV